MERNNGRPKYNESLSILLNNPLKYVDPLGLNPDRMLIMVDDGGGRSRSTPAPIVNTKPKQNVVNQVKEQVVKKETSRASSWSCKVANDGNDNPNYQYIIFYDPIYEEDIENKLRQEYEESSLLGKGAVIIKTMGHALAKRYRLAKAELQKNIYEQTGMDPIIAGDALDASVAYVAGEVAVGSLSRGYKSFKGTSSTVRETLLESVSNQKLKNAIDQIYRPSAKTGDGGLADAIRHELKTGELVGGKSHIIKGTERVKNLENILKTQNLNQSDLNIAQKLLNDLKDALGGK